MLPYWKIELQVEKDGSRHMVARATTTGNRKSDARELSKKQIEL